MVRNKAAQARYREKNRTKLALWQRAYHDRDLVPHMLAVARNRAAQAGIEFSISKQDVNVPSVCPVLGIKIERGLGRASDSSPSLDRVDNQQGYIPGNVRVISWRANRLKGDGTAQEHHLIAKYIASNALESAHAKA